MATRQNLIDTYNSNPTLQSKYTLPQYLALFDFSQTTPQEDLMMRLGNEFDNLKPPHDDISYQKNNPLQYNPKDMAWAADRVRFTISKRSEYLL